MNNDDYDEDEYTLYHVGTAERAGRIFMYVFNTIFFFAGSCMFALGVFVQFDEEVGNSLGFIGFPQYYTANVIIIFGSLFLMFASVAGIIGTKFSHRLLLIVYLVLSVIAFCINLGGATYLLSQGLESTNSYGTIRDSFLQYMYRYQYDIEAKYRVDVIQEYILCCGAGHPADWTAIHLPIPNTCRDQVTGNQYKNSCAEILARDMELYTGLTAGMTLWVCLLQLFTLVFVACIYRGLRTRHRALKNLQGQEQ